MSFWQLLLVNRKPVYLIIAIQLSNISDIIIIQSQYPGFSAQLGIPIHILRLINWHESHQPNCQGYLSEAYFIMSSSLCSIQ